MASARRLEGKVAMITGGASGIGAESARLFAEHGAAVAVADINDNLGPLVVRQIEEAGGAACYVHLDTVDEDQWRETVKSVLDRFGRLDIMLNAAGVSGRMPDGSAAPRIGEADLANWNRVMDVNSTGVFLGTKHAIEAMRAS
ncbi:MAG: SDR family NAD(P)-dependent oxidoreductase, partial [Alphaproteobacteria bacterium]|nr:SDR family NAD(P)-dependent oxidoreductase [Alphaproteobacteria bacterium]